MRASGSPLTVSRRAKTRTSEARATRASSVSTVARRSGVSSSVSPSASMRGSTVGPAGNVEEGFGEGAGGTAGGKVHRRARHGERVVRPGAVRPQGAVGKAGGQRFEERIAGVDRVDPHVWLAW